MYDKVFYFFFFFCFLLCHLWWKFCTLFYLYFITIFSLVVVKIINLHKNAWHLKFTTTINRTTLASSTSGLWNSEFRVIPGKKIWKISEISRLKGKGWEAERGKVEERFKIGIRWSWKPKASKTVDFNFKGILIQNALRSKKASTTSLITAVLCSSERGCKSTMCPGLSKPWNLDTADGKCYRDGGEKKKD